MPEIVAEIIPCENSNGYILLDNKYVRGGFHNVESLERFLSGQATVGTHVYSKNLNAVFKVDNSGSWYKYDNSLGYVYSLLYETAKEVNYKGSTDTTVFTFERADQYQVGDILGWDLYLDTDGNIMGTYGTVTSVDTANKTVTISNHNVEVAPFAGTFIYKVGSTSNNQRSLVLVSHLHQGVPTITQYHNSSVDNLFKDYTLRVGKDDVHDCNLFAEEVYLKGTFINSDGTNIGDSVSTIAEVKTTADEALATADRVRDVSIDLGTRVNDLETVTSSHSNTITGIQGKVSELEGRVNINTDSSAENKIKITELTQQVVTATETANAASALANNMSNVIGTIQSNASDALNSSQIALDALGGKKIVTILESEYGQLATKDPDTLYFCMPDSGGSGASLD